MAKLNHEKIATHAKKNRWSATAVAERIGVTQQTVSNVFAGKAVPSATNLKAICDVIGLPVEDVFIETEKIAA